MQSILDVLPECNCKLRMNEKTPLKFQYLLITVPITINFWNTLQKQNVDERQKCQWMSSHHDIWARNLSVPEKLPLKNVWTFYCQLIELDTVIKVENCRIALYKQY